MQVPLAVIADGANVTADNKLNLLGIFDRIYVETFPAFHLRCHLVVRFRPDPADEGQHRSLVILFQHMDGPEPLFRLESSVDVGNSSQSFDNVLQLQGLPLPRPGEYQFSVIVEGHELATVPLTVGLIEPVVG
jgi:hypothetical protein